MIRWAWRSSAHVDANLSLRLKFVRAALREPALSRRLSKLNPATPLAKFLAQHPQTIGALIWPYQCAAWDATKRFERISAHLDVIEHMPGLKVHGDEKIVFAHLTEVSDELKIMIDYSPWLAREGLLTLSLFKGDFRAFTIAFSLFDFPRTKLFIGGIQGRKNDGDMLSLYREITKLLHGVRPRDFVLEMVRMFALKIGVKHLYAVADDYKIARHSYFANKNEPGLHYDEVWAERGALKVAPTHFELPLTGSKRELSEVAPKKRAMYRRRYEMFDAIEAGLPDNFAKAKRLNFQAT